MQILYTPTETPFNSCNYFLTLIYGDITIPTECSEVNELLSRARPSTGENSNMQQSSRIQ